MVGGGVKVLVLLAAVPLDLVAVLDFGESIAGAKLAQVKQTMGFVVDHLGATTDSVQRFICGSRRSIRWLDQRSRHP